MREAARGGGLFLIAEQPGGWGMGIAAQLLPRIRPHRSNTNQQLVINPLFLGIGPSSFCCTPLTRRHRVISPMIYFGEIGEPRPDLHPANGRPPLPALVCRGIGRLLCRARPRRLAARLRVYFEDTPPASLGFRKWFGPRNQLFVLTTTDAEWPAARLHQPILLDSEN
jgi:hypothetical protein